MAEAPAPLGGTLDLTGLQNPLQAGNQLMSGLTAALRRGLAVGAPYLSTLSVTYSSAGGTTVVTGPGTANGGSAYLCSIFVTTPSTGSTFGFVYDSASPASVSSTNIMALIPLSGSEVYNIPFVNGLTIQPSSISTQRVSVYYINEVPSGG